MEMSPIDGLKYFVGEDIHAETVVPEIDTSRNSSGNSSTRLITNLMKISADESKILGEENHHCDFKKKKVITMDCGNSRMKIWDNACCKEIREIRAPGYFRNKLSFNLDF